jgi:hypothetical protein
VGKYPVTWVGGQCLDRLEQVARQARDAPARQFALVNQVHVVEIRLARVKALPDPSRPAAKIIAAAR